MIGLARTGLAALALSIGPSTALAQATAKASSSSQDAASPQGKGQAKNDGAQAFTISLLHKDAASAWSDIDLSRSAPLIRVLVNGVEVCGLIDTGSGRTVIDTGFAREHGLTVVASDRRMVTNSGSVASFHVPGVLVEVPGQFRFTTQLVGIDLPDYTCPAGDSLRFILGHDVMQFLAFAIDPERRKMVFLKSGNINPRGDNWARIDWVDRIVTGSINGKPARFMVDTGAGTLALVPANRFETYFADMPLDDLGGSTDASGYKSNNVGVREAKVTVGPFTVSSEVKRVVVDDGPEDANLGFPFFLWTFTIFDAAQGIILMEQPKAPND